MAAAYTLRRSDGSVVDQAPARAIQPTSLGALLRLIQIPLAGTPPGDYELEIIARDERAGVETRTVEPFTITGS